MCHYISDVVRRHDEIDDQQVKGLREKVNESHYDALTHVQTQFSLRILHLFLVLVQVYDKRDQAVSCDALSYSHVPLDELEHFNH